MNKEIKEILIEFIRENWVKFNNHLDIDKDKILMEIVISKKSREEIAAIHITIINKYYLVICKNEDKKKETIEWVNNLNSIFTYKAFNPNGVEVIIDKTLINKINKNIDFDLNRKYYKYEPIVLSYLDIF